MRGFVVFIERTALGGLLFLLPLALIGFLAGQLVLIVEPVVVQVTDVVGGFGIGPLWMLLITLALLVGLAFTAGLVATTVFGRSLVDRIEGMVLNQVPGYSMIKSAAADAAHSMAAIDESQRKKAVFVASDEFWQIGFVTDEMDGGVLAVFIPDAPAPEAGALIFVPRERVVDSGLSTSEALACLRRLGTRMPRLREGAFAGPPMAIRSPE